MAKQGFVLLMVDKRTGLGLETSTDRYQRQGDWAQGKTLALFHGLHTTS